MCKPRLEDRHLATRERGDLLGVLVDAGHVMAEIGKAGPGDEAHVTGADHCNVHAVEAAAQGSQHQAALRLALHGGGHQD
jgi:hypothetical protein